MQEQRGCHEQRQHALEPAGRDEAEQSGLHQGYVLTPDIDAVTEQINGMEAMRAYEANAVAAEASKTMMAQALRLIA